MAITRYAATHWSGRRVEFDTYAEARRFVLRRGDANELWEIEAVSEKEAA